MNRSQVVGRPARRLLDLRAQHRAKLRPAQRIDSGTAIRSDSAAAHVGGTNGIPNSFDYVLPFFFGRSVFVGFAAPNGPGPYWTY